MATPSLWECIHHAKIVTIINFNKEQTILIPVKDNHTCTKEINLMPSKRFSNFKIVFVKNEKKW